MEFYLPLTYSSLSVFEARIGWAYPFDFKLNKPPAHSSRPIIPDNARNLRITATAGTKLVVTYS